MQDSSNPTKPFQNIDTKHEDVIHDVAYDFYGKRMATCSSDQKIKIWDQNENGEWQCNSQISKAHAGSVWKVAWAHPEFGQVLASCSFDRTVCIWEEDEDSKGKKEWKKRATLVDSRDSVQDIKFAPSHQGLKIATASSDGFVRTYEAMDLANLDQWPPMEEFEAHKLGVTCLSWNPAPTDKPMIVSAGGSELKIWEYNNSTRKWVQIFVENLVEKDVSISIHDVCWAPNLGRSYHLIAAACKDRKVRIWKWQDRKAEFQSFDHNAEVWRVEWNVTGTILASSGDDGTVRLWKTNFDNKWKCLTIISGTEDDSGQEK